LELNIQSELTILKWHLSEDMIWLSSLFEVYVLLRSKLVS